MAWSAAVVLAVALLSAAPAAAQRGEPSSRELWRTYPLGAGERESTPEPPPKPAVVARPPASASEPARPADTGGGTPPWLLVVAATAVAAGAAALVLRRRRERAPSAGTAAAGPSPPDPTAPWAAEIRWHPGNGTARFVVVAESEDGARPRTLAETDAMAWPPSGTDGLRAIRAAIDDLSDEMRAAGWEPRPRGDEWYARRFAWRPREDPQPAQRAPGAGRDGDRTTSLSTR